MRYQNPLFILIFTGLLLSATGATNAAAGSTLLLRLDGNALSADIDRQPVAKVISTVNRLVPTGCSISGYVFADPGATVSRKFQRQPLVVGLRKLLRGYDYLLRCSPGQARSIHLKLLGGGEETQPQALSPVADSSEQDLQNNVPADADDADPGLLLQSLYELLERNDIDGLTAELAQAAAHSQSQVRLEALRILLQLDAETASELIDTMALNDPDVEVRSRALEMVALRRGDAATELLKIAAADEKPWVSQHARLLLQQLR